jgi:hypothetical protein
MCLVVGSDGHLTIKVMYEQVWPRLHDGTVEFTHCYDLILRSHGDDNLKELHILSPHSVGVLEQGGPAIFNLLNGTETRVCDWILGGSEALQSSDGTYKLRFASLSDEQPLAFRATRLKPVIAEPQWISNHDLPHVSAAFLGTGMTMAVITFKDGQEIRKYAPERESETTYWLRLAFRPVCTHDVKVPIAFGRPDDAPLFHIQPTKIRSPEAILNDLLLELETVERDGKSPLPDGARRAVRILDETFRREGTSTRIENNRISVVTDGQFWVSSPLATGLCGFVGVAPIRAESAETRIAHMWFAGASSFEKSDALAMARLIYLYLRDWALNETNAKTKEQITSAIGPDYHENISHVVEALVELKYLHTPKAGYFAIIKPALAEDALFLKRTTGSEEVDLSSRDNEIRRCLYGSLAVPGQDRHRRSKFRPSSFKIQYDLVFAK